MIKSLAGTVLVAAAATSLMAAPANASTAASTSVAATASKAAITARPQLIRTNASFGRCRNTCRVKVRIRNISRKNLFDVKLNVRLTVNGRKAGTCYDHVGSIRARKVRHASCTVRTSTLNRLYNRYLDGYTGFRYRANTSVAYRYYR
ncbi:hypothetical protein FE391_11405 [Nonomuraea sp. KC401]|uniref:hypothetical protein n=1 Tax=unclassified Nonomuraea TaxID=2593643 RepID=UPI0010FECF77|nr:MULTISPECIES: hypothetical protein [unclassified Nonomuraea]NBE94405.1 hypothetical protein [Nonomuraea sp. K271]TLF77067.1 hypothetical protein FE391_11405 [Nonomuraea sp. KC401]